MKAGLPNRVRHQSTDEVWVNSILEKALESVGPDEFSSMKLLKLEKLVRSFDPEGKLPKRTTLRELIHAFRVARWASAAPKRVSLRFR